MSSDIKRKAEEALERAEKATKPPWDRYWELPAFDDDGDAYGTITCNREEDHEFLVASRTDLPDFARVVLALAKWEEHLEWAEREDEPPVTWDATKAVQAALRGKGPEDD
jgi:hypothetical protein